MSQPYTHSAGSTKPALIGAAAELCALCEQITARLFYLDTVHFLLRRHLSREALANARWLADGATVTYQTIHGNPWWPARLYLGQPTYAVLEYLREALPPHVITRADAAFDLMTGTPMDARLIHEFIDHYWCQRWRGNRDLGGYRGETITSYQSDDLGNRRYGVMYCQGEARCHIEFRFQTAHNCRLAGLGTLAQLMEPDLPAIVRRELCLRVVADPAGFDSDVDAWLDAESQQGRQRRDDLRRALFQGRDIGDAWHQAKLQLVADHLPRHVRRKIITLNTDSLVGDSH